MNLDQRWSVAGEATLQITSQDLALGMAKVEAELALHTCRHCNAEMSDRYHFDCPECGHEQPPVSSCRSCSGELQPEVVRYVASGSSGGTVTKMLAGVTCQRCGVSAVEHHQLLELDALARRSDQALHFLPELGIHTPLLLEVLVDAEVSGPGEPSEVIKQSGGLSVRVGSPSALFVAALELVTEQNADDLFSATLQVTPGPPYSAPDRRQLQLLIAQLQVELDAPLACWSASMAVSEDAPIDPVLTEQLSSWASDRDRTGLALYNAIVRNKPPGRFSSSFRLLELVLQRRLEEEIAAARDAPAPNADFKLLVRSCSMTLSDKLSRQIRSMPAPPLETLQRLWLRMRPGLAFDESKVYDVIASFRRLYADWAAAEQSLVLPWEEPDFDGCVPPILGLISAILEQ
jgi:hypothetical protein